VDDVRITLSAFADLDGISIYLEEHANERIAAHVERRIFAAFDDLVRLTALGHRREDVRQSELRFYAVFDYLIVFRREPRVVILRVIHGAQDIPAILAEL
jgi:plasmid stabilization system protein ParE